jgi:hypothetical protein
MSPYKLPHINRDRCSLFLVWFCVAVKPLILLWSAIPCDPSKGKCSYVFLLYVRFISGLRCSCGCHQQTGWYIHLGSMWHSSVPWCVHQNFRCVRLDKNQHWSHKFSAVIKWIKTIPGIQPNSTYIHRNLHK